MSKIKNCYIWLGQVDMVRTILPTAVGILLLSALMIWLPAALADEHYAEGDYLHHLWRMEDDARFQRDLRDKYGNPSRNAPHFCAIAYSKSTGKWGYGWGKASREDAEQAAKRGCRQSDSEVLCWAKDNWYCALADGPNSYGAAPGETAAIAKAKALKIGNSNGPGCRIVLLVGGNSPGVEVSESGNSSNSAPASSRGSVNDINLFTVAPRPRR